MAGQMLLINPRKRTRRKKTTSRRRKPRARRRSNPTKRRRRRASPRVAFTGRAIGKQVQVGFGGAVGALGLDVAMGYLPFPEQWKGGYMGQVVKGAVAIGAGALLSNLKVVGAPMAFQMSTGALTVILHNTLRTAMQQFAPQVQLGAYLTDDMYISSEGVHGVGYAGSGYPSDGAALVDVGTDDMDIDDAGMGAYVNGDEYGMEGGW